MNEEDARTRITRCAFLLPNMARPVAVAENQMYVIFVYRLIFLAAVTAPEGDARPSQRFM